MNGDKKQKIKTTGVFSAGADYLTKKMYGLIKKSAIGKFFRCGDSIKSKTSSSYVLNFLGGIKNYLKEKLKKRPKKIVGTEEFGQSVGIYNESTVGRSAKKHIRNMIESSVIVGALKKLINGVISLPVMSVGIFLLAFGISVTAVQAVKLFVSDAPTSVVITLGQGILILLLSLPALLHREENIYDCFRNSRIGNFIMFSMMGADFDRPQINDSSKHYGLIMFSVGALSGLFTLWFNVALILMLYVVLVCAVRVLFAPEFGVVLLLLCMPFGSLAADSALICAIAVLYISVCFFIKVAVGKRSINFCFTDFFVVLFAVVMVSTLSSDVVGTDALKAVLVNLSFMSGYFVIRNMIRSQKWIERCLTAFFVSSFLVSVISLVQSVFLRSLNVESVFLNEPTLAVYVGVAFIVTLSSMFVSKHHTTVLLALLMIQISSVFVSGSKLALVMLALVVMGFMIMYSRKTFSVIFVLILAIPAVSCFVTGADLNDFWLLATFREASQSAKVEIWNVSFDILGDHFITGIGMGGEVFANVFAAYSPSEALQATNSMSLLMQLIIQTGVIGFAFFVSIILSFAIRTFTVYCKAESNSRYSVYGLGIFASLVYMLLVGMFVYVWEDPIICLMFWTLLGLAMSSLKFAGDSAYVQYNYLEEVNGDISIDFVCS